MHFEIEHLEKVNLKKIYFIPATVFQQICPATRPQHDSILSGIGSSGCRTQL